jgi:outer membrane protein assembly factor BamB
MYNREGTPLWKAFIGEFPMVLEIDADYNVYAAGKNRELFSFDVNGNLRWRRRIANHVVSAGANNMSADGKFIVLSTVGGWVYAFDDAGEIAWQRPVPGGLQGHNALDMTPDGRWIVVGTAGTEEGGGVVLYDRNGTLLSSHHSEDRREAGQYDHNQTGVITVAISDDGSRIAAGYGDSVIRIFERER